MSTEHIYDKFQPLYSELASFARSSEVRDLLSVTGRPDIISLAGGLPNTRAHDFDLLSEMVGGVLLTRGAEAFQYGPTEGDEELKVRLVEVMAEEGLSVAPEHVIITTGSQQGLELLSRLFINVGDTIITEAPTYVGALASFQGRGPQIVSISLDDAGIQTAKLREEAERLSGEGIKPKFIYVVPNFHNPAGVTMHAKRRRELIKLIRDFGLLLVEDNPYGLLRLEGEPLTPLAAELPGDTVYLGTLSKIIGPGLRLGWMVAPAPIHERLATLKQSADLCTSMFTQKVAVAILESGLWKDFVERSCEIYRRRLGAMLEALEEHFPGGSHWTHPQGGLYVWVTLPEFLDCGKMLPLAIERKVAYVPGSAFYSDHSGKNCMRLCFSYPEEDRIREGIKRLGKVIKSELELYHSLGIDRGKSPR